MSYKLAQINSLFIDTAPIIYYIEAHPQFGPLVKKAVTESGNSLSVRNVKCLFFCYNHY